MSGSISECALDRREPVHLQCSEKADLTASTRVRIASGRRGFGVVLTLPLSLMSPPIHI